ncbi:hypothetical protein ACWCYY_10925 [Kitasatospora sp. NPDC001664]
MDTAFSVSQHTGDRTHQADATAHHHNPITGHTAWVLLDGIGDREHTATWTPGAARALAATAAGLGDPAEAICLARPVLRAERAHLDHPEDWPADAAAIVAVLATTGILHVGWAGDCRGYTVERGRATLLTLDHNEAADQRRRGQAPEPDAHDHLTSSLCHLNGEIGHMKVHLGPYPGTRRLVLLSDGVYLPHESAGTLDAGALPASAGHARSFPAPVLAGTAEHVADQLTALAIKAAGPGADNATAMVIDLTL